MKKVKLRSLQFLYQIAAFALFAISVPFFLLGIVCVPSALVLGLLVIWFCLLYERAEEGPETKLMLVELSTIVTLGFVSILASLPGAITIGFGMLCVKAGEFLREQSYLLPYDSEFFSEAS
ncbi:hypothetical protein A3C09_03660 [Candidatus Uhrbacteria bacterium RIFCSPHIGHO2_02_FULL_47_44]|uniref:Uncharacterized protein n=1 Tax=Candidatus Uhrbacteria bacterium RIFCSPLOWO2_02_FULL_48_18 TaxID=1802408 RepID=A0A1F7V6S6_9BACT|nr:MAG: hypothetical protein A2839_04810 [Candidatus Uhrbacteria bacterium RIFCSPHIGHO2_01_FULL_47_10]OGL71303.1 MAG: hypothetical protein A3C09_03660 [Candidatus Uhrbacteria bacterium RIFCSPHIGHO2_02_FULL_47_44]OGL77614.1 MAG: hypothetical protein A3E97_05050 [Candidatus Uhrbacteria bacterium RIFCSPHIGHO2_12_FULL_47_12]OGL80396.1 MAG: hypothetical protein A3B20_03205 [Candidatus Uhrbacteria bacterium RIFCSPLOWO2_01_FULL_47_17]OGL86256.1 MAG: hypothetical protein A3I41_01690 [Candidatus Uhrbact